MPTILILFGLKFRIYVRDHEPVHVHVLSQDGEAKFQVGDEIRQISRISLYIERSDYGSEKSLVRR